MASHLFNYCPVDFYEDELKKRGITLEEYTAGVGVDGIEAFVYELDKPKISYPQLTIGTHLCYWPYWMGFWKGNTARIRTQFRNSRSLNKYFLGASTPEEWVEVIRRNIKAAATLNPAYMVWHVANADMNEIFTWDFRYTSKEVLETTAEVFNKVADSVPETSMILFENLWWPGLKLTDPEMVRFFFDRIEAKNVGIMLDTGHLMNTNVELKNEQEAADYVCRTVDALGEMAELIKGVHFSCSLSGEYQKNFDFKIPKVVNNEVIWKRVTGIDRHQPFTTRAAAQILNCVKPEYITHELAYNTLAELEQKIKQQLSNI